MKSLYALAALFVASVAAQDSLSESFTLTDLSRSVLPTSLLANVNDDHKAKNVQVVSNVAHHRCVQPGQVTTVFDGFDVNLTPTLLKSIKRQLEVAFFVPSPLLLDNTIIQNGQAALRNNHILGLRFNPAHDNALNTLTEEKVNAELATGEVNFRKAFQRNLQYVLFAYGTPDFALKIAEQRKLRVIHHNLDFSGTNVNHIATLDANFVNPATQSFITLQNAYNKDPWSLLRLTHNAAVARNFNTVRLSTCQPPLRPADIEAQAINNNAVNPPPPANPQAINNNSNAANLAATGASLNSALIGCAIALAVLVLA